MKGDLRVILPALFILNGPLSEAPVLLLALMMMGNPGGCWGQG